MKSPSVTSLLSEKTPVNKIQMENKSSTEQADINKHINTEEPPPDKQTSSSPMKFVSLPALNTTSEHKLSEENQSTIHTNEPSVTATASISSSISHPPTSGSEKKTIIIISFFHFTYL